VLLELFCPCSFLPLSAESEHWMLKISGRLNRFYVMTDDDFHRLKVTDFARIYKLCGL